MEQTTDFSIHHISQAILLTKRSAEDVHARCIPNKNNDVHTCYSVWVPSCGQRGQCIDVVRAETHKSQPTPQAVLRKET